LSGDPGAVIGPIERRRPGTLQRDGSARSVGSAAARRRRPSLVRAQRRFVSHRFRIGGTRSILSPIVVDTGTHMARWPHILLGLFIGLTTLTGFAADGAERRLVGPQWLAGHPDRSDLLLLDASMPQQYAAGHIPGAVNASAFLTAGRDLPPAVVERQLQGWGVSPGRKILVYDEGGSWMAARLFWDLYYHGFALSDLYLLDGGLHGWKAAGQPVTRDTTPAPATGSFRVTRVLDAERVRLNEFLAATGDPARHAIVDALEPPYYYGGARFFDRAGHIPNALLWPSSDFFEPLTKTFKSPDEIRRMLAHLGIRPDQTVHVYCGGGGAAAVPVFALRFLLGRDHVKLYNESQREWLQDERGLPLWTHAAPHHLRRAAWLEGWGGAMMRMVGLSNLSVVDLRPPAAYAQGHVPFALNIPADVFRAHLHQPARLAELLGAAGVNPRHEAVLVADGGLSPDTALAIWLLERMGQKKVSLLADSFEDWAFGGFTIAKEPTVVGTRRTPQDLVVPAVSYPHSAPVAGKASLYPRIVLASGRQAPPLAQGVDGSSRLIHLPYTELLEPGGSPKPAKELWGVLARAGVPRYGEIVTVADDAGEAAVSWFVLKLMGFADIRLGLPD
jgi:3-mercaptopyruvate sulfurtransferase SseA